MRFLKIGGIIIGVLVLLVIIAAGVIYYKIKHVKDTHDLAAQLDKLCNPYVSEGKSAGLFVGIIQGDQVYTRGYGFVDKESKVVPDSNTLFEIGSVSKVFTSEIAQLLVEQNQLSWTDNISKYLPTGVKLPVQDTTTLMNLASHTSGFPRLPERWFPKLEIDTCNPYSHLTVQDLLDYLNHSTDKKKPSLEGYEYSNLGAGLLGHILEWRTGKTYETLLQEYIAGPLQMHNTATMARDTGKLATGYAKGGEKTCHWDFPVIPGAGAIISTGADMLRFLKANMEEGTPLGASFKRTQKKITDTDMGPVAYGWHIDKLNGLMSGVREIVWHNGGTGGFRSYIGLVPGKQRGVVVLSNQDNEDFDALAIKIMVKTAITSLK